MKRVDRTLLLTTALCLAPMLLAAALYGRLPERVPVHWNFAGEVDGWASRAFAGLGIPALLAGLNLLAHAALRLDPRRAGIARPLRVIVQWTAPGASLLCVPLMLVCALGVDPPVERLVPAACGLLLAVTGNYLPKTRRSWLAGVRLPWTLCSEENWRRANRAAGVGIVASGLVMLALAWALPRAAWLGLALLMAVLLASCAYSFALWRRGV